jgi:hypothetical protein
MTILTPPRPAPEWLRDLAAARAHYEELFGWPVSVDIEPRRVVVPVGEVLDAVTMPAALGEQVLAELHIAMMAGPVIAGPNGTWWTFLTQPATASRPEIAAELHAVKVCLTPRGAHAILPTADDNNGAWRWIAPPQHSSTLPPWSAVIAVTRRVATSGALAAS